MARLAVFASGSGSNFQKLAEYFEDSEHSIALLIYDRKKAYAKERAESLGIKSSYVSYFNRDKEQSELEILEVLKEAKIDICVLAGFMRIISSQFLLNFWGKVINIHPSLLPKYPGVQGIKDSWESGDSEGGITIHLVDEGIDTGPILFQTKIPVQRDRGFEEFEQRIHQLEHTYYPRIVERFVKEEFTESIID
jgi:phosphoribosylglycinamide formyltransferase-1